METQKGEELRHTPDPSGLLSLLEKPKLGDREEPSCSGRPGSGRNVGGEGEEPE